MVFECRDCDVEVARKKIPSHDCVPVLLQEISRLKNSRPYYPCSKKREAKAASKSWRYTNLNTQDNKISTLGKLKIISFLDLFIFSNGRGNFLLRKLCLGN